MSALYKAIDENRDLQILTLPALTTTSPPRLWLSILTARSSSLANVYAHPSPRTQEQVPDAYGLAAWPHGRAGVDGALCHLSVGAARGRI